VEGKGIKTRKNTAEEILLANPAGGDCRTRRQPEKELNAHKSIFSERKGEGRVQEGVIRRGLFQ